MTPADPLPHAESAPEQTITLSGIAVDAEDSSGTSRRILHPVSIVIDQQRTAVIGANGSGKSTFLRVIAGLLSPAAGELSFSPQTPRTGFIFSNPQAQLIMPVVGEDIDFSLRRLIRSPRERAQRVAEILASVDLADRVDSSIYDLSSGERQKVALAGVLATQPGLVLADEPTTLLDLRNAAEFQRRLLTLSAPLIYATHDLDFASAADRVIVFDSGRIIADGEPRAAVAAYRERALSED